MVVVLDDFIPIPIFPLVVLPLQITLGAIVILRHKNFTTELRSAFETGIKMKKF